MKIVRLVLWSIVAVLLISLLIAGLTGRLTGVLPEFHISGCSIGGSFNYPNSELYTVGGGSALPSEVSDIEIHWVSGDVTIASYSGSSITFSESSAHVLSEKDTMRYYISNGKLIIQFCAPYRFDLFGSMKDKSLTVYIPGGFALDRLMIDAVSAAVRAEELTAESFRIDTVSGGVALRAVTGTQMEFDLVSGQLKAEECVANKAVVDTVSGSVELAGSFREIKCDSVSGSVTLAPGRDLQALRVDTVSGKVTLRLPENEGFTARYDSVSGAFRCDFEVITGKDSVTYKNGNAQIKVDTVSGSISILRS
jgi:DUF4097 and DUF4098 domain-containing protein YvlB